MHCAIADLIKVRWAEFHEADSFVAVKLCVGWNRRYEQDAGEGDNDQKLEQKEQELLSMESIADCSKYRLRNHPNDRQNEVDHANYRGRVAELLRENRNKRNDGGSAWRRAG